MRFGISSHAYTWSAGVDGYPPPEVLTPMALLDNAVSMGIGVVQIVDNMPLHLLSDPELDALARRAGELNISIEIGTLGLSGRYRRQHTH